jgi:hypothetical protein
MTSVEQRKVIQELRDHTHHMRRSEQEDYEMFAKRDKDDEDLDEISRRRLQALYVKYVGPLEER